MFSSIRSWSTFGEGLRRSLEEVCLATKNDVMKAMAVNCLKVQREHARWDGEALTSFRPRASGRNRSYRIANIY